MNPQVVQPQQPAPDPGALRGAAARLPLTLRPSVVQQLDEWDMLFPFEQNRLLHFLRAVDSMSPRELDQLIAPLRSVEEKMDVRDWSFSATRNTMENSAQLARSEHYGEWRRAVTQLFTAIDARADSIAASEPRRRSLLVMVLPESLPVKPEVWRAEGRIIPLRDDGSSIFDLLLAAQPSIGELLSQQGATDPSDLWAIDAAAASGKTIARTAASSASYLPCALLESLRVQFLAELNTIPRDTHVASQTLTTLQQKDWSLWWPSELAGRDRLRNFVVELYLSGNGALIFSNSFVEWAAAEAMRRARPRVLFARFGLRGKPKPFTSIAIFENQARVSTLPDIPDPESSAVDAALLARYVWLSAHRYQEYDQALCLCVAEHLHAVQVVSSPPGSEFDAVQGPQSTTALRDAVCRWLIS